MITFAGVMLTFGKIIIDPQAGQKQVSAFNFPSEIPLKGWEKVKNISVTNLEKNETDKPYEQNLATEIYYYQKGEKNLEITMSYVVGTLGRAKAERHLEEQYTRSLTSEEISPEWIKKQGLQYAIFEHQQRLHLVACINPRGGSSVTSKEFRKIKIKYDLKLSRFLPWLMGEESLLDRRCLWNNLSLPITNNSPEKLTPILEEAWFAWYQWWSQNFPHH